MASSKSILEKLIAAMNRGGDTAKHALLKGPAIEVFRKPNRRRSAYERKARCLCARP
jgi:hypothetical protein